MRVAVTACAALASVLLGVTRASAQGLDPTPASHCGARIPGAATDSVAADTRVLIRLSAGLAADTDDAFLARALGTLIAERLRLTSSIDVRARALMVGSATPDAASAVAEGRVLGVRFVLVGTVERDGDRSTISWRLVDARSGKQLSSGTASKPVGAVDQLVQEMTSVMTRALGRPTSVAASRDRVAARAPEAIIEYLQGLVDVEAFDRARLAHADSVMQRAVDIDPTFTAARYRLAELALRQLDWVERRDRERRVLVRKGLWNIGAVLLRDPYDVQTLSLMGRLYLHGGQAFLAQPIVIALRQRAPSDPATIELDARLSRAMGDDSTALRMVRAAAEATERSVDALMVRADLERRVGDKVAACRVLNRIIALDPMQAPAYVWRALLRSNLGERREGWADAEVATRLGRADWGELTAALIDIDMRDTVRARTRAKPLMQIAALSTAGWLDLLLRAALSLGQGSPLDAQHAILLVPCSDPRRPALTREPLLRFLRLPQNCAVPPATGAATR